MKRRVPAWAAGVALAAALLVPAAIGRALLAKRPEERPFELEIPARPSVSAYELIAYDVAALRAGDWVEYDNVCSSGLDVSSRIRTRLACVGVDGDAAWIESRDLLLARFYPGTVILMEASRSTGLVKRAWWGAPGGAGSEIAVEAPASAVPRGEALALSRRRAAPSLESLETPQGALACELVRYSVKPREGEGTTSDARTWFSASVPFPRRVSMTAADDEIDWDAPRTIRGGVVREEYRGVVVRSEMVLTAWGRDARATLVVR